MVAGRTQAEADELLLRLIADAAMLHALLQESNESQFAHVKKRLEMFLNIVQTLPGAPSEKKPGIGFIFLPELKKTE